MVTNIKKTILLLIAFGLIWSLSKNIIEYRHRTEFYQSYLDEYEKQQSKKRQLQSQRAKNNDYWLVEKNIREKLNLLKPNEIAVILPQPSIVPSPTPVVTKQNWQQWYEKFVY